MTTSTASPTTVSWPLVERDLARDELEADLLPGLVDGRIAILRLRNLLPDSVFDANRERLRPLFDQAVTTRYVNGSLTTIGPYLAKYLSHPDDYFTVAGEAQARLDAVRFDLADQVRTVLGQSFGLDSLEPAIELDHRRYGAAVVRVHADGVANPLHNDNIMRDAAGSTLSVQYLVRQLSCVVCIEECDTGGELRIFNRPWRAEDERYKIDGGLGYRDDVVAGAEVCTFKPSRGDVYLINPTNYHEIARVGGANRTTLGFFIGFPTQQLSHAVVWG